MTQKMLKKLVQERLQLCLSINRELLTAEERSELNGKIDALKFVMRLLNGPR